MAGKTVFTKPFTQQEPLPEAAIARAVEIMRSGRLHRYNTGPGEESEAALLERDYARYQGAAYCIAVTSGGFALQTALRALGVRPGDKVLANAYTLAPVPGAIHNAGAAPVFVETDRDNHIDPDDLDAKAARSGARCLMLSHMRGHVADMDRVTAVCRERGIKLIEDCAHTMGARWKGVRSGNFGAVACFSAQTYKHVNGGEGGLITTDDPEAAARSAIMSGSYMLYGRHGAVPDEAAFARARLTTPNYSGRIDNLRAALIRAQLPGLDERVARWNRLYAVLDARLRGVQGLDVPARAPHEAFVGSSFQFRAQGLDEADIAAFVGRCAARGVDLKWFGEAEPRGYTSRFDSWRYVEDLPDLPRTRRVLAKTLDLRLPLTFDEDDARTIATIIAEEVGQG